MKKIKLLSWFLLVIFFTNCEKEEVATEIKEDNIVSISSSKISISELYNEIQTPEIKTILQNKSFYKLSNDSFSRINDANVTFIKIQKRDSLTTYILNLNSYSQQNPYFLKFIITKNYNETEKVGYLKYIPTTPTVLLDLKSFTGEAQILNNELEITASTQFINGVKQENQSKTENLLRGRCRDLIDIVEVKCSHSGEHGVGESCNTGYINDAHYEIYITTTCNDPSTPVEIIDDTSNPNLYNDGAGGSITDVLENILTPEELLWWNNANVNTKNAILDYLNPRVNDGEAWMFVKEAIKALKDGGEVDFYNEIINKLEGKALCIYNKLQNLSTGFNNAINKFDGQFTIAHLEFKLDSTGETLAVYENGNIISYDRANTSFPDANNLITITLNNVPPSNINNNSVNQQPNLLVAQTIIHEIIHAEFFRQIIEAVNQGNLVGITNQNVLDALENSNYNLLYEYFRNYKNWSHTYMAAHYRDVIARTTQEFITGIAVPDTQQPEQLYLDLAWRGLMNNTVWENLSSFQKVQIENIINNYLINNSNQTCIN
ncbi:hypothetical protein [Flavobacterium sp. HNIBRBA15423]|uniref:hypothetical protein n=1 Tax=Flavobacterium sp. HNIBRBA15423 TaxID=3458683 RepID=UPI00404509A5